MNPSKIEELLSPNSAGAVLALIHSGRAVSRTRIMQVTGLSRSTVTQRLDALLDGGYIRPGSNEISTGGRPQGTFQLNQDFGVLLLADISAQKTQIALADMHGRIKVRRQFPRPASPSRRSRGSASGCPARWNSPPAGWSGRP